MIKVTSFWNHFAFIIFFIINIQILFGMGTYEGTSQDPFLKDCADIGGVLEWAAGPGSCRCNQVVFTREMIAKNKNKSQIDCQKSITEYLTTLDQINKVMNGPEKSCDQEEQKLLENFYNPYLHCPNWLKSKISDYSTPSYLAQIDAPKNNCNTEQLYKISDRKDFFPTADSIEAALSDKFNIPSPQNMISSSSCMNQKIPNVDDTHADEIKKIMVSEYYFDMNQLKKASLSDLENLANIESQFPELDKDNTFDNNCKDPMIYETETLCKDLSTCSAIKDIGSKKKKFQTKVKSIKDNILLLNKLLAKKDELNNTISKSSQVDEIYSAKQSLESLNLIIDQTYEALPLLKSNNLKKFIGPNKKFNSQEIENSYKQQLQFSRNSIISRLTNYKTATKCLNTPSSFNPCRIGDLNKTLASIPNLSKIEIKQDSNPKEKARDIILNQYLDNNKCLQETSSNRDEYNNTLEQFVFDIAIAVGTGGVGQAMRAGKSLGIGMKMALVASGLTNLSYLSKDVATAYKACSEQIVSTLDEENSDSNNKNKKFSCTSIEDNQEAYTTHLELGECLVSTGVAALDIITFTGPLIPATAQKIFNAAKKVDPNFKEGNIEAIENYINKYLRSDSEHLIKIIPQEAQNTKFISLINTYKVGDKPEILFLDVENSILKQLNDQVLKHKGKQFITALTNRQKEIFITNLQNAIEKDFPELKDMLLAAQYSDFKSMRFAFNIEKLDPSKKDKLKKLLNSVFEKSQKEFASELNNDLGLKDFLKSQEGIFSDATNWHKAGIGETADQASTASRYSRFKYALEKRFSLSGQQKITDFVKSKKALEKIYISVEKTAKTIEDQANKRLQKFTESYSMFMDTVNPGNKKVLSADAFEVIRKTKLDDPDSYIILAEKFNERFKFDLNPNNLDDKKFLENIIKYSQEMDIFDPSLYILKREIITMEYSQHGAASVDFAGFGAANKNSLATSLRLGKTLDEGILNARAGEKTLTTHLDKLKEFYKKSISSSTLKHYPSAPGESPVNEGDLIKISVSGDDGMGEFLKAPLSKEGKKDFVALMGGDNRPGRFRTIFVPQNLEVTKAVNKTTTSISSMPMTPRQRADLILYGEGLEKELRLELLRKGVFLKQLHKVMTAFDIHPDVRGGGSISIIVNKSKTGESIVDPKIIESAIKKVLKENPSDTFGEFKIDEVIEAVKDAT